MALYKISASRVNNIQADQYTGSVVEQGLIWYDPQTGELRLYTGTPGGRIINAGSTPGGQNAEIQFNKNGEFGGSANLTFNAATGTLGTSAVAATGNISAQYFVGNGRLLTGINTGPDTELVNGTSNVRVYPNGPVAISVDGVANVAVFEGPTAQFNAVQAVGNITTNAYFIGDGSKLTGIPPGYGNSNVVSLLSAFGNNTISTTGNVTGGNVNALGNISGNYFIGNGSQLTGLPAGYANADVAAYLPTYTGNLVSLTGAVTTSANITGNYFIGNGSQLTGLPESYANANVAAYLPTYTGNLASLQGNVTTTANITGNYILGNGSQLTGLPETYANANVAAYLPTYTGNLASLTGVVTTTANITGNYFIGNGSQLTGLPAGYANADVAAYLPTYTGNLASLQGNVTTTANITANYFVGNGSQLTGLPETYANANVAAYLPTYTGNLASLQGNVTTSANISGNYILGNGSQLTGLPESYANANVAAYLPTYTGNLVSLTGAVTTTANVTGNYFIGNGSQLTGLPESYANANVAAYLPTYTGNLASLQGNVTTTANVTGNYFIGNGSQLTGLPETYANANVAAYLPTYTGNLASLTGVVTTTANITGNYFIGNGSQLTGVSSTGNLDITGTTIEIAAGASETVLEIRPDNSPGWAYLKLPNDATSNTVDTQLNNDNGNVSIGTGGDQFGVFPTWLFDNTGNLTLPEGGSLFSQSFTPSGSPGNTIVLQPAGSGFTTGQKLMIYPTANDGDHIHLTSGNLYQTELFLGSDNFYVKLANTGDIVVQTDGGVGNTAQWTFGSGGTLTAPGNIIVPSLITNNIRSDDSSFVNIEDGVNITGAVIAAGNVVGNYFIGNGSQLTGLPETYANANVAAYLPTYTGNLASLQGNVTTTANITANYFIGDGSQLTGITAQGLPSQTGNAGLFLSTDGSNVVWNGALGGSLTFSGGQAGSDEFGSDLNGGTASDNFVGATSILGGNASSNYSLTLSSVALTGQPEDMMISSPPLLANSAGAVGQVAFDVQWLYICVSNNNWKRTALASW
jgi:acetaldehyde dehydrogenase (acetylating)